ncbi:hypothetical protein A3D03_06535 [Candidatus Gottesmanbacteria bacterium RIFCSPHIGHO2_02_FULL_40_13]|uniref:Uncharacterized protein n=1 Tax=Candidatus Gottesmanbacteria bacterium RIFCSPHIGHO2_02_FULL_40_13 TaxID=1798384 RepID=A0A1F6A6K0_9BACT|nr:MAG: hypothetical protein A3D03_06535 [Candidatus Gottesmanbacteria bacterium RIFCSPHIGHO2_02_FULL_40_13]
MPLEVLCEVGKNLEGLNLDPATMLTLSRGLRPRLEGAQVQGLHRPPQSCGLGGLFNKREGRFAFRKECGIRKSIPLTSLREPCSNRTEKANSEMSGIELNLYILFFDKAPK